jgi:hypothetical protein
VITNLEKKLKGKLHCYRKMRNIVPQYRNNKLKKIIILKLIIDKVKNIMKTLENDMK